MDDTLRAQLLGGIRLGIGAGLLAAPGFAGRIWVGPDADGPGTKVFARAVGARDVLLGLRILKATRDGESINEWVRLGFLADVADSTATVIAARHLTTARRIAMPLIAGAVGAVGYAAMKAAE